VVVKGPFAFAVDVEPAVTTAANATVVSGDDDVPIDDYPHSRTIAERSTSHYTSEE
jgi:hypothetical protein